MRRIVIPVVFLVFSGALNAASETVIREVTGYGDTREEAVSDALVQGVQQVSGIEINAASSLRSAMTELIKEDDNSSVQSLSAKTDLSREMQTKSSGYVKSYQVISVSPDGADGRWRALVRVEIPVYKASGQNRDGLRTLAILPFRGSTGSAAGSELGTGSNSENAVTAVKMNSSGGVYEIPVVLNEALKINMIIDSGASDVFVTADVVSALIKSGTVTEDDDLGVATYTIADGSTVQNQRFRLKSVKIGDRIIRNVDASISNSIEAPMLLGQSALEGLGQYSFDYSRGVILLGAADGETPGRGGGTAVAGQLSQALVTEFTQARKFRVLDREYLSEYLSEQEFLTSANLPVEETLRLGQRLGADFILVGAINDFKIRQKEKEVLGIKKVLREASLSFDFRVLEVATQEIRWSNTFSKRYSNSELAKLIGGAPDDDELVRSTVIQAAGHETATEMLDVIFPLRIVQVEAGEVYLNQGGIRVKEGEIYDVFESGRKVIDPSTGLKLPIDGRKLASIEIVRVAPKVSVGVIIPDSGEGCAACDLLQGVCRRADGRATASSVAGEEKSDVTW